MILRHIKRIKYNIKEKREVDEIVIPGDTYTCLARENFKINITCNHVILGDFFIRQENFIR